MNKDQKYIATQAIFKALTGGRKLSQMDCREFEVEDNEDTNLPYERQV